jgi:hypothetical protein
VVYPLVDFKFRPRFAKQEILKIAGANNKKGGMVADFILEVRLKSGSKRLLFIHIEVQSSSEENFGRKMFRPFYWLMDKYGEEVTAIAIFVGEKLPKQPDRFEYSFGETRLLFTYPIYIVKDQAEESLLKSNNLFSIAVLACKHLLATKPDKYEDRFSLRIWLVDYIAKKFKEKNLEKDMVVSIASFVVNLLILPEPLEYEFELAINEKYKNQSAMREVSIERQTLQESWNKIIFGTTVGELKKIAEQEAKLRKEEKKKLQAEKKKMEAKRMEMEAKRMEMEAKKNEMEAKKNEMEAKSKEAEAAMENLILTLHKNLNMQSAQIASLLNMDFGQVDKVIKDITAKSA